MAEKPDNNEVEREDNIETNKSIKLGQCASIEHFTKDGLSSIVEATKAIHYFPSGAQRDLYCAYPSFGRIVDTTSDRILGLILKVLQHQNVRGNIQRREKDEQFELLTECNDVMLEKINSNLDELAGIKKHLSTISTETIVKTNSMQNSKGVGSWNLSKRLQSLSQSSAIHVNPKIINRPQLNFKIPIDNSIAPFEPKIKEKPNSLKPLAILPEYNEDGIIESYLHPYEFELLKFEPSASQLESNEANLPKLMKNTPFELIENEDKLKKLVCDLRDAKEIAVDVEHHSYRSFQGMSCLIQLSTRSKDYVIDALKLRDELHLLNEIFTHTGILKIFHGADLDIQWLQRDFGLYVVNMFDTHQAAKILGLPRLSLAYLLKNFCDIEADKTYQLADWRIRPLPEELVNYARQDTHYLIYIYELLRNELICKGNNEINLLKTVYQRSTEICRKRYVKPTISQESHMDLYRKSKKIFDNRQLFALREIFQWRDKISRKEDESYGYVLPNHMILQIAESLPREMQGILACCNPIPPLVRQNLHTLHQIVLKARDQPLIKPIFSEQIENRIVSTIDSDDKLYCPHDTTYVPEFRDDLPTSLSLENKIINTENSSLLTRPVLSVFETSSISHEESTRNKLNEIKKIKFVSPYERYKAVIPYAEKQKIEEIKNAEAMRKEMKLCPVKNEPDVSSEINKQTTINDDDNYKTSVKKNLKRKREVDPLIKTEISDVKVVKKDITSNNTKIENDTVIKQKNTVSTIQNNLNKIENIKVENQSVNFNEVTICADKDFVNNEQADLHHKNIKSRVGKKNKKYKLLAKRKTEQSSKQPVQFDYSKVDFKKFQGGAGKAQQTTIKSKFHGKSKAAKNTTKKFDKMFTFGGSSKK